jgi:AraC family transcriptional regulator
MSVPSSDSIDARRVIHPDQLHNYLPSNVLAEATSSSGPERRIFFRDYKFTPTHSLIPGMDSFILIFYKSPSIYLRRRFAEGWKEKYVKNGDIGIIGATQASEWEWLDHQADVSQICLSDQIMASTAASAFEQDYKKLEAIDIVGVPDPTLRALGDMLSQELIAPHGGANLLIDSLASAMSVHLIRQYHHNSKNPAAIRGAIRLTAAQRMRVLDYIEANLSRNFGLSELAAAIGLSETHFGSCFKSTFGESPHQFVLKQRVQLAIKKIIQSTLSFAEIAHSTGFFDQAHLTHVIKKATGQTPRSLRNW